MTARISLRLAAGSFAAGATVGGAIALHWTALVAIAAGALLCVLIALAAFVRDRFGRYMPDEVSPDTDYLVEYLPQRRPKRHKVNRNGIRVWEPL